MNNLYNMAARSSVLVVDDEPGLRTALQANFMRSGWNAETASGVQEAIRAFQRKKFDLVVSDVRMRDGDGLEVLCFVQSTAPGTPVILLTAFGSVPEAVESMRGGALDYLTKPVSFDQLHSTVMRVMRNSNARPTDSKPIAMPSTASVLKSRIIGRSPALLKALSRAQSAASTDSDVLIQAESGTGKELMARFIHDESSRKSKPFIAVNCAAFPEHLLESELFGHAKGAFTGANASKAGKFEVANGGTLLLDEIGDMPLNLQPKLLRVLQEREFERIGENRSIRVDIRVIATTNAALASMVESGKFRSDLYYRLNVIPLSIPTLRERIEDIPALALHFAETFSRDAGREAPVLAPDFIERLQAHTWPGNVREFANFMRRVLSLHQGGMIDADSFHEEFEPLERKIVPVRSTIPTPGTPIAVLERMHLENTLAMFNGNRTRAAEMLGISIRTMRNKIKEYGLPPRRYA